MSGPSSSYEFWSPRIAYICALLAAVQFYPWHPASSLGTGLRLICVFIGYIFPSILVETSLGLKHGPPDAYFSTVGMYRGVIAGMLCSLFIAIPFYATSIVHSVMMGYDVIAASYSNNTITDLIQLHETMGVNDTVRLADGWDAQISTTFGTPSSVIALYPGIAVLLLWLSLTCASSLGPQSLGWVVLVLFSASTVFSLVLFGTSVQLPGNGEILELLRQNFEADTWTSLEGWKDSILFANRQSLLGFGLFGTLAAYASYSSSGFPDSESRTLPAFGLIALFVLYPLSWFSLNLTRFSIENALIGGTNGTLNLSTSEVTSEDMHKWIGSYHIQQACILITTLMLLFEVWCNTWSRVLENAFPFTFRTFHIYRPAVALGSGIILGSLNLALITNEGTAIYQQFHRYCHPFLMLELCHALVFFLTEFSSIWDRIPSHRVVAKRHDRKKYRARANRATSMLCRLTASLGLCLFTLYLLAVSIYRAVVYVQAEIAVDHLHYRSVSNSTASWSLRFEHGHILGGKILMTGLPWLVSIIASIYWCIHDRKSGGCRRVCCVSPESSKGGYRLGNNNANEHYWPDEFEVLPYEPPY